MAADIKTIKEEMTNLKSAGKDVRGSTTGSTSSSNGKDSDIESIESSAVSLGPELDTAGYLGNLRRAFRVFLNCRQLADLTVNVTATSSGTSADIQDKSISSSGIENDEALKKGCQALSMYARKVLDNPTQPRYRKISVSNASFKNLVKPLKGHVEVLSAIGFIATVTATPCYEWAWYFDLSEEDKSQSAVAKTKRQGKPDAEGVKEILKECIRYLDICTSEGLSSLEKELDKYDIVPPLVDTTKESVGKITSIAADATTATTDAATADVTTAPDATKTLLSSKETDTGSITSSSRENRTKSEVEVGSDGTADGSKISERSSNSAAELNLETASNTAEPSAVCLIKQTSDTQANNIPASNAPAIPVETPSLLFSDVS